MNICQHPTMYITIHASNYQPLTRCQNIHFCVLLNIIGKRKVGLPTCAEDIPLRAKDIIAKLRMKLPSADSQVLLPLPPAF